MLQDQSAGAVWGDFRIISSHGRVIPRNYSWRRFNSITRNSRSFSVNGIGAMQIATRDRHHGRRSMGVARLRAQ
jgi:hypothetical protein